MLVRALCLGLVGLQAGACGPAALSQYGGIGHAPSPVLKEGSLFFPPVG